MSTFKIGTLVWAKMKGFPAWPGVVTEPPKDLKTPKKTAGIHCIYFFGTKNYGWIETHNLQNYSISNKAHLKKGAKSAAFQDAVKEIEFHLNGEGDVPFDPTTEDNAFDRLMSASKKRENEGSESDDEDGKDESKDTSVPRSSKPKSSTSKSATRPPKKRGRPKSDRLGSTDVENLSEDTARPSTGILITDYSSSTESSSSGVKETPLKRRGSRNSEDLPPKKKRAGTSSPTSSAQAKKKNYDADTTTPAPTETGSYLTSDTFLTETSNRASNSPSTSSNYRKGLLERPPNISRPDTPPLNLGTVSKTLREKKITPSGLKFGFLGLGVMGSGIVTNLINSGHSVIVWNRSPSKCQEFAKAGADVGLTPSDVVFAADITFSCVADPKAARDLVFGNCNVLDQISPSKSYVEMTGIDKETSLDIAEAIQSKGGRYLEAQLQGSKKEAEEGTLVIISAGDRSLYNECHSCFESFGRILFFLGEVGNATNMNLIIQMMLGVTLAGLAEGMALAKRAGLQQEDILEVMSITGLNCPSIMEKGRAIVGGSFPTHLALSHLQKDLHLALALGDEMEQPLPMTATANEIYKHAKRLGYGSHDASAVYIGARF